MLTAAVAGGDGDGDGYSSSAVGKISGEAGSSGGDDGEEGADDGCGKSGNPGNGGDGWYDDELDFTAPPDVVVTGNFAGKINASMRLQTWKVDIEGGAIEGKNGRVFVFDTCKCLLKRPGIA